MKPHSDMKYSFFAEKTDYSDNDNYDDDDDDDDGDNDDAPYPADRFGFRIQNLRR